MNVPTFQVCGLRKIFRMGSVEIEVLRGLDFEVASGEIIVVIGASGSGKTTLLHCLGGLDTPTSGRVCLQGMDLYALSPVRRTRIRASRIGFVFQSYHLLPELDALDNVLLPARNRAWPWSRWGGGDRFASRSTSSMLNRAAALLETVGLADRVDHLPGELSGGEQQRVALARALMNDPDVVLADEPTGNLDAETGRQVLGHLIALVRRSRKTLVMVTHNPEVARMADRILELRGGRLGSTAG